MKDVIIASDYLIELGRVTIQLAQVKRAPRYPNGDRETDVEHSFHLALAATEMADAFFPELDVGLVARFSLVHDLAEIYTGDTWTFDISNEELENKEIAEKKALAKLAKELPPNTKQLLMRYEEQLEPESRFVRFVDKLLPAAINIISKDVTTFKEDYGIEDSDEAYRKAQKRIYRLQRMFPEFPLVHFVHVHLSTTSHNYIFKDEVQGNCS